MTREEAFDLLTETTRRAQAAGDSGALFDVIEREYQPAADEAVKESRDQLDRIGWNSHAEAPVWTLGYHDDQKKWQTVAGLRKSQLLSWYLPRFEALGRTPWVTRERALLWAKVVPGAY